MADEAPFRPEPGRHAALVGGTATGKSTVALALAADDADWEIVTVDSMQVYRGMDVGTAKPTPAEQALAPHHLLDLAEPWEHYDVATYQAAARAAISDIEAREKRALLVGGTALYLRAVVDDLHIPGQYPATRAEIEAELAAGVPVTALHDRLSRVDPLAASRIDPHNERRITRALEVTVGSGRPFSSYGPGLEEHPPTPFRLAALRWSRDALDGRIDARYDAQLDGGFLDEVHRLLAHPRGMGTTARQALGYRELAAHVEDGVPLGDAVAEAKLRTRRFSRRQDKWFRRDPRIAWFDVAADPLDAVADVRRLVTN